MSTENFVYDLTVVNDTHVEMRGFANGSCKEIHEFRVAPDREAVLEFQLCVADEIVVNTINNILLPKSHWIRLRIDREPKNTVEWDLVTISENRPTPDCTTYRITQYTHH